MDAVSFHVLSRIVTYNYQELDINLQKALV